MISNREIAHNWECGKEYGYCLVRKCLNVDGKRSGRSGKHCVAVTDCSSWWDFLTQDTLRCDCYTRKAGLAAAAMYVLSVRGIMYPCICSRVWCLVTRGRPADRMGVVRPKRTEKHTAGVIKKYNVQFSLFSRHDETLKETVHLPNIWDSSFAVWDVRNPNPKISRSCELYRRRYSTLKVSSMGLWNFRYSI